MARLIKILAASVGGGVMLGAGIRLGEAIAGGSSLRRDAREEGKLAERLGALEDRLRSLETESPGAHIDHQATEVASIRSEIDKGDRELEALSEVSLRLRGEMRGWIEESVTARMNDVESKLKAEADRSQKQMLDAFVESVQTRVMHRIARLEEEVSGQSAAMAELRECSMRTEQSIQKLLGGLDRLIVAQPPSASPAPPPSEPPPPEPVKAPSPAEETGEWKLSAEIRPKSRRWSIFG